MKYTTNYSKTITSNNQTWSADNGSNDIITRGIKNINPDIKISQNSNALLPCLSEYSAPTTPDSLISGLTWDGNNIWSCCAEDDKIYKHNMDATLSIANTYNSPDMAPWGLAWDGTNIWSIDPYADEIYKHNMDATLSVANTYTAPGTYGTGLTWDGSTIWSCDGNSYKIYKHNMDATLSVNDSWYAPSAEITGLMWDGNNIWSIAKDVNSIHKHSMDLTLSVLPVITYYSTPAGTPSGLTWDGSNIWSCDYATDKIYKHYSINPLKNISIYNTATPSVICEVANTAMALASHRINNDGTGYINLIEDFTTDWYYHTSTNLNAEYQRVAHSVYISIYGYLYYLIDTKYPITGIPTLTALIDMAVSIPTIQISSDAITWYDIDTAIVDDVLTIYELDNAVNLQLAGLTQFYFRFDCALAECEIYQFELDINMNTTTAQNPIIYYDTINTFKCDQDSTSGITCTVELEIEDDILQPITIF